MFQYYKLDSSLYPLQAYRGVDDKVRMFRPLHNMARLNGSAERACLPTFEGEELVKCMRRLIQIDQEWIPHTEASSLYIRPTMIGKLFTTEYAHSPLKAASPLQSLNIPKPYLFETVMMGNSLELTISH